MSYSNSSTSIRSQYQTHPHNREQGNTDKEFLYADWKKSLDDQREHQKKRNQIGLQLVRKANDLPMEVDDDGISNTVTKNGLTWKEILAIGAVTLVILFLLGKLPIQQGQQSQSQTINATGQSGPDSDTRYQIRPAVPKNEPRRTPE